MKVLVISRSPWRMDNSFGNTYSNIFKGMADIEIANIFLCDGKPDYCIEEVTRYYQIRESEMLNSIKHPFSKERYGKEIFRDSDYKLEDKNYQKTFKLGQKKRWPIFYILRDCIWNYGRKNWNDIYKFVDGFKPDLVFMPLYYANYVSKFALKLLNYLKVPLVMEVSIDVYSLRQLSFDPLYWLHRFSVRKNIRNIIKKCSYLYTISDIQKQDYEKMLKIKCGILYKFLDRGRLIKDSIIDEEMFAFTGNIGNGRWKILALLGKEIRELGLGKLYIYTPTQITNKMREELKYCELNGPIKSEEVVLIQNKARYLVHVESFSKKNVLEVRYSISTKIMDYLSLDKEIIAIGPNNIASIEFLKQYNKAHVCTSIKTIRNSLENLDKTQTEDKKEVLDLSRFDRDYCQKNLHDNLIKICNGGDFIA